MSASPHLSDAEKEAIRERYAITVIESEHYYADRITALRNGLIASSKLPLGFELKHGWDSGIKGLIKEVEAERDKHMETLARRRDDGTLLKMRLNYTDNGILESDE
jgi:hypothetical protein